MALVLALWVWRFTINEEVIIQFIQVLTGPLDALVDDDEPKHGEYRDSERALIVHEWEKSDYPTIGEYRENRS